MDLEKRITDLENTIKAAGLATKEVLTLTEACTHTGLSRSCLYKLTSGQKIPHYKPMGKLVYFDRKELEEWVRSNRVSTKDELADKASSYCLKKGGVV